MMIANKFHPKYFDKDNFLSQDNGLRNEMVGDQDDLSNFIQELDEEGLISSRNNQ